MDTQTGDTTTASQDIPGELFERSFNTFYSMAKKQDDPLSGFKQEAAILYTILSDLLKYVENRGDELEFYTLGMMAFVLTQLEKFKQAKEQIDKALTKDPDNIFCYLALFEIAKDAYNHPSRGTGAFRFLSELLSGDPEIGIVGSIIGIGTNLGQGAANAVNKQKMMDIFLKAAQAFKHKMENTKDLFIFFPWLYFGLLSGYAETMADNRITGDTLCSACDLLTHISWSQYSNEDLKSPECDYSEGIENAGRTLRAVFVRTWK